MLANTPEPKYAPFGPCFSSFASTRRETAGRAEPRSIPRVFARLGPDRAGPAAAKQGRCVGHRAAVTAGSTSRLGGAEGPDRSRVGGLAANDFDAEPAQYGPRLRGPK